MSHCSPAKKKGAQSLRKGTTALVSKLRLSETHFTSGYHTTYHQRGSIHNSYLWVEVNDPFLSLVLSSGVALQSFRNPTLKQEAFFHFLSTSLTFSEYFTTFIRRPSHKSKSWFIFHLLFLPIYCSHRLILDSPPGALVWGCEVHDGSVGGWIALPAISWLFICRCVCVLYNLWVSTMASNAFPLHRWDNGNARVNSVPLVDCNWISGMSGANRRSGKLQPSCPPFLWLHYDPSALLC